MASSTCYSGQGHEGARGPSPKSSACAEASFTQPGPDTGGEPPALLQPPSGHSTPRVLVFMVQGDSLRACPRVISLSEVVLVRPRRGWALSKGLIPQAADFAMPAAPPSGGACKQALNPAGLKAGSVTGHSPAQHSFQSALVSACSHSHLSCTLTRGKGPSSA